MRFPPDLGRDKARTCDSVHAQRINSCDLGALMGMGMFIFHACTYTRVKRLYEGLQAIVAHSKFALRVHELYEATHGFAKSTQEVVSNSPVIEQIRRNFLRQLCEAMSGFAKLLSPEGKCGMCYCCL